MNREKSLKLYKIKKETRCDKREITTWVARKEFNELTKDKNCFGKITPGIKPELMSDAEYMEWIKPLPSKALVL